MDLASKLEDNVQKELEAKANEYVRQIVQQLNSQTVERRKTWLGKVFYFVKVFVHYKMAHPDPRLWEYDLLKLIVSKLREQGFKSAKIVGRTPDFTEFAVFPGDKVR